MNIQAILSRCDHTLLAQTATWAEIQAICDDGMKYQTASVCIPPSYVKRAKDYVGDRLQICTVIGFPNGYHTTAVKLYEALDACDNGASEIDMVININEVKNGEYDSVEREIRLIADAVHAKGAILKVIIETCYLTEEEKIRMCRIVTSAGADFIKTSTGFGTAGATLEDVKLMAANVGPGVRIKAAGGIRTREDAMAYIRAGASRIGSSGLG